MSYSYYPGCSVKGMNISYENSAIAVAKALDLNLNELDDWNCCGATSYMSVDEFRSILLSGRNLALAEKEKKDLVTTCAACFNVLNKTNRSLNAEPALRNMVQGALGEIGLTYSGSVRIRHLLDILVNDVGEEKIRRKVVKPLKGLKVAPYYGCQINRPKGFDDPERPESMDHLLSWSGATVVEYHPRTVCCGGTVVTTASEVGYALLRDLLYNAKRADADLISVACPMCYMNLEAYQDRVAKKYGGELKMPIAYFTQLLGLAIGLRPEKLDIGKELVPILPSLVRATGDAKIWVTRKR